MLTLNFTHTCIGGSWDCLATRLPSFMAISFFIKLDIWLWFIGINVALSHLNLFTSPNWSQMKSTEVFLHYQFLENILGNYSRARSMTMCSSHKRILAMFCARGLQLENCFANIWTRFGHAVVGGVSLLATTWVDPSEPSTKGRYFRIISLQFSELMLQNSLHTLLKVSYVKLRTAVDPAAIFCSSVRFSRCISRLV